MSGYWTVSDLIPDYSPEAGGISSDEDSGEKVNFRSSDESSTHHKQNGGLMEHAKAKWFSGAWPITPFDGSVKVHERKAEWFRFRDLFESISSCKITVDPVTKLNGLKIYAGPYLSNIIGMQMKKIQEPQADIYSKVIEMLNAYFNKTCDVGKEQMKFREMRMAKEEAFEDWILRLENQARFCEFDIKQHNDEFLQAIIRRSVPEISDKLFEMSEIFERDLERIKNHGQHLDFSRRERESMTNQKVDNGAEIEANREASSSVNALLRYDRGRKPYEHHRKPYEHQRRGGAYKGGYNNRMNARNNTDCRKCGRKHGYKQCKAFGVKCYKCKKLGHFAEYCQNGYVKPPKNEMDSKNNIHEEVSKINQVLFSDSE